MEGGGPSSGSYDKSKVLDVKPLRCLAPIFPSPPLGASQTTHPFVCAPPFGPFPPGYTPFYPFYNPSPSQPAEQQTPQTPPAPVPSFRTSPPPPPPPQVQPSTNNDFQTPQQTNGKKQDNIIVDLTESPSHDDAWSDDRRADSANRPVLLPHKRSRKSITDVDFPKFVAAADGNTDSVWDLRFKYDALRRRISQVEDAKGLTSGSGSKGITSGSGSKRTDLKAGTIMMSSGLRTNTRKRIGNVSGVEVGDIFFFRMEICLVGLHAPSMAGIDYMAEEETLAVSIVSSGGYDDENEESDVLIYSGQGGNVNNKKDGKIVVDQKLERGNLALERSLLKGNEVRVIRGVKDVGNPTGKVYIYDGLYKILESWMEKGKSGCNLFKYKLLRIPGQPEAFAVWKSVQRWKENPTLRPGLILPDLTSGAEKIPVSLVNDIDDDKGPAHFTYCTGLQYSNPVSSMKPSAGCQCKGLCISGDPNCSCVGKNGGLLPHVANGVLVSRKPCIHECGPSCLCYPNCRNQVSQNGLRVRLEVFKTKERGWGLRSWDPIRAGGFICEYAGQVIDKITSEKGNDEHEEDAYVFDTTCTFDTSLRWNYLPDLLGEEKSADLNEEHMSPLSLAISAKNMGNVARFMNHSCSPNAFWQPVLFDHSDDSYPHIMFYAIKHIPPMTELTYDYGSGGNRKRNMHGGRERCLCGSVKCKGYFG